ncbi:MAG: hypothetical protein VZQ83_00660 [Eubacterium sp.]|nr:hypothetical protein [Eubacterium sp.]
MNIVDAIWEKRNLGCQCKEILFDNKDSLESVESQLNVIDSVPYLVLRVPVNRPDIVSFVQKIGFRYIECIFHFSYRLSQIVQGEKRFDFDSLCDWREMNQNDLERLQSEIRAGMFGTDRVALDPVFSAEISATRYINWINDLCEKGIMPNVVLFDNKEIGFFINEPKSKDVIDGILIGIYNDFKGLGYYLHIASLVDSYNKGYKKLTGRVSSNNPEQLRLMFETGQKIRRIDQVFIKHCV